MLLSFRISFGQLRLMLGRGGRPLLAWNWMKRSGRFVDASEEEVSPYPADRRKMHDTYEQHARDNFARSHADRMMETRYQPGMAPAFCERRFPERRLEATWPQFIPWLLALELHFMEPLAPCLDLDLDKTTPMHPILLTGTGNRGFDSHFGLPEAWDCKSDSELNPQQWPYQKWMRDAQHSPPSEVCPMQSPDLPWVPSVVLAPPSPTYYNSRTAIKPGGALPFTAIRKQGSPLHPLRPPRARQTLDDTSRVIQMRINRNHRRRLYALCLGTICAMSATLSCDMVPELPCVCSMSRTWYIAAEGRPWSAAGLPMGTACMQIADDAISPRVPFDYLPHHGDGPPGTIPVDRVRHHAEKYGNDPRTLMPKGPADEGVQRLFDRPPDSPSSEHDFAPTVLEPVDYGVDTDWKQPAASAQQNQGHGQRRPWPVAGWEKDSSRKEAHIQVEADRLAQGPGMLHGSGSDSHAEEYNQSYRMGKSFGATGAKDQNRRGAAKWGYALSTARDALHARLSSLSFIYLVEPMFQFILNCRNQDPAYANWWELDKDEIEEANADLYHQAAQRGFEDESDDEPSTRGPVGALQQSLMDDLSKLDSDTIMPEVARPEQPSNPNTGD
eukprot:gene2825-80_t